MVGEGLVFQVQFHSLAEHREGFFDRVTLASDIKLQAACDESPFLGGEGRSQRDGPRHDLQSATPADACPVAGEAWPQDHGPACG